MLSFIDSTDCHNSAVTTKCTNKSEEPCQEGNPGADPGFWERGGLINISWPAIADMNYLNSVIRVIKLLYMESMGKIYQSRTV